MVSVVKHALLHLTTEKPADTNVMVTYCYVMNRITFGRSYGMVRFVFQCMYYILVLAVTFCQVYLSYPEDLKLAFVGIIAVAAVFLWLEFQQCLHNPRGYLLSPYNFVDIAVFALPMAASAVQIYEITQNGDGVTVKGNTRPFSFSILVIYLHLVCFNCFFLREPSSARVD